MTEWNWYLIWAIQNNAKTWKTTGTLVNGFLIWEYPARAIQWIPIWQGLDGFQKSLRSYALKESSLSIGWQVSIPKMPEPIWLNQLTLCPLTFVILLELK